MGLIPDQGIKIPHASWCDQKIKKHTHTQNITNKDPLYSTGNSTQYSIMTYMGKESKKELIYAYA